MVNFNPKLRSLAMALGLAAGLVTTAESARAVDITSPRFPENKWVKLDGVPVSSNTDWYYRQVHSTLVFDSKRKTLLIFGSDTHSTNFDNIVREFNPSTKTWTKSYPASDLSTYQKDSKGQAIANSPLNPRPWAMHTFDDVVYDPKTESLVSVGKDDHNYAAYRKISDAIHPTWFYSPAARTWNTFVNHDPQSNNVVLTVPQFFATGAEYDPDRDIIWAGNQNDPPDLWYIDSARNAWITVPRAAARPKAGFNIQYSMVYDTRRHKLAFFGTYSPKSTKVAFYTPGNTASVAGTWEVKTPVGDVPPNFNQVPVAYDSQQGVFLLVPKNTSNLTRSTFVYDVERNAYVRVPNADNIPTYND